MNTFSIRESILFGWETFKKRPLVFLGAFIITLAVSGISSALLEPEQGAPMTGISLLLGIISALVGVMVELGILTFSIRAHDAVEKVDLKDLWNPQAFVRYLLGQIVVGFIVIVGLLLLIVPGIIAALGLMLTPYLIIDKGMQPIEAIKESWRVTKGHRMQLFLFVLSLIGINILGVLALVVGLLVSIPVSVLAVVHVYRLIVHTSAELTPVALA